jgi:pilus assembly protein CpaC
VSLTAGRSTVIRTEFEITRIAVTNPAVADATVVESREILIDGKAPGTVSLIVWSRTDGSIRPGRRACRHDAAATAATAVPRRRHPGQRHRRSDHPVRSVSSNTVSLRAAEIAQASSSKVKLINMLQLPSGQESQQVMLQVRFAEVNRRALMELGANFVVTRQTTQGAPQHGSSRRRTSTIRRPAASSSAIFSISSSSTVGRLGRDRQAPSRAAFQSLAEQTDRL